MHNMLNLSMACFPYVLMGLGQAVIAGTNMPGRETDDSDEIRGRRITRLAFDTAAPRVEDRTVSGYPVLSPQWGKV